MSWRRLDLHAKPTVFYNPEGFWDSLFDFLAATIARNMTPKGFSETWTAVDSIEAIVPTLRQMVAVEPQAHPLRMPKVG